MILIMSYILVGAGGHAKVILDILRAQTKNVVGVLDDNKTGDFQGIPILGTISNFRIDDFRHMKYIIAIGDNKDRFKSTIELERFSIQYGTAIHPSAIIGSNVSIGKGTVVMPNSVINHSSIIGKHTIVNTSSTIDHDCYVSDYTHISPGVHLAGGVKVGRGTHIGIGANVIENLNIGRNSIIGAGSVVVRNIPDYVKVAGVPANIIESKG